MSTGKDLSDSTQVLSCALEKLGFETNSLNQCAYICEYPKNCVLSVRRTEEFDMLKTTKYYNINGADSTTKFVFEVKNNPQKHCANPTDIYPTNYNSVYVALISGGFDLISGLKLGAEPSDATQSLLYRATTENDGFPQLYAYDPKHKYHKTGDENMYFNMNYGMQMGTKLDYLFFQQSWLLQPSELKRLRNQCDQERTEILTVLMLLLEN